MAYLSKNHKTNSNQNSNNNDLLMNSRLSQQRQSINNNGFKNENKYKNSNGINQSNATKLSSKLSEVKEKQKREAAKKAITKAADSAGPAAGIAARAAINTPKGQKYIDAYAKGETEAEGIRNVKREIKKDTRRRTIILFLLSTFLPLLLLMLLFVVIFKNSDSQIYSNQNGGTVKSDNYIEDDKLVNIFANYPGLYEKIIEKVNKVSDKYKIEIDRYLIIATLVAPIQNELIIPVEDGSCGEEECYYFKGESKTWTEFLSSWGDQAELLAKMELLTYTNNQNELKVKCGSEETMEQYAQNDLETNTFPWYGWLNPVNWFKGFVDAAAAEVNAKCVTAKNGDSEVPTVKVLSIEQGEYYKTNNSNKDYEYVKDPNSGGVYFWNLVNKNGFLHEYLKDYLSDEYSDDPDKNYEINKDKILEIANYIYSYYESIRKDCNGFPVIKGELEKVDFREDGKSPIYTLDFEDVFVGGSVLATYGSARGETLYAQVIITRSEAYNYIVEQHQKVITGSAKMGCWWWKYNPTYDPSYENQEDNPNYDPDYPKVHFPEIYKAVTETRGIVVTEYDKDKVLETEYDAFCPTTSKPINGFYYLPDGQRNLPIEDSYLNDGSRHRAECPCFQNNSSRPGTEYAETLNTLLKKEVGTPAQTTNEKCWTPTGTSKTDDDGNVLHGYEYEATGGHGRGLSQHGMAYFSKFGYDRYGIIKVFLERGHNGNLKSGVSFKKYEGSIESGECDNYEIYKKDTETGSGGSSSYNSNYSGESNYNDVIGGTPLNMSLEDALAAKGHTIEDLNNCIGERVKAAGYGTREGVVEAGMGLLECTMDLTGGYTYPYDHSGGRHTNADLNGKLGVNTRWGMPGGTGCAAGNCRLGLNCATFVRWSMCNGGMNLCDKGSTFAHEMYHTTYFPEAIKLRLSPGFRVLAGNTTISSVQEAVDSIKPGDMLYSNRQAGGANHVMLVVGTTDSSITIAENGRKTRSIAKSSIISPGDMEYGVLLLDDFYANSNNVNDLSW